MAIAADSAAVAASFSQRAGMRAMPRHQDRPPLNQLRADLALTREAIEEHMPAGRFGGTGAY
jgi:hypothetical protein